MGKKYLGEHFDIHGGGMDLIFPHHECEIAQSVASQGNDMVHYWMHNNMITINGQKMGKSYGNFINLDEFFNGTHKLLTQAYSPMTIRFFILQAHYRSTVDFSNEALQAAEKGLTRMMDALKEENNSNEEREIAFGKVVDMLLEERMKAKANKDWATSDKIRNELTALGFEIKDGKDGCEWKLNK